MRTLITGAGGQLATYLVEALTGHALVALSRSQLDITDAGRIRDALERARPDVVINTAAFHNLPQCERDVRTSFEVNARAPYLLGKACREVGAKFVHVSTDYVFGNVVDRRPLTEDDLPAPLSVYAASKLAGEHLVRQATDSHLLIRTCGLYGARESAGKKGNFVLTMLRLARERGEVRVVNDQRCSSYLRQIPGDGDRCTRSCRLQRHVSRRQHRRLHVVRVCRGDSPTLRGIR